MVPMAENKKEKKGGTISEDDVSMVLLKYSATTILALLREISQSPDVKMDWDALVKNTSTGITNPHEFQMLWRHLAYRKSLEVVGDNIEVLDDDSDLEYELEALPPASDEALNEAAACVKVLLASGLPNDSGLPNCSTVEAPLTINIPNGQASAAPSDNSQSLCPHGTNITVPVSVQKQQLAAPMTTGGLDGNGLSNGNLPARKKRKPWTPEEDLELIAAVEKCGERNWANILKGDFKGERTASQLSQRWSIIRKKRQTNPTPVGSTNFTGSQLSEAQLAARHALNAALNMPMIDSLSSACLAGVTPACNPSASIPAAPKEVAPVSAAPMETSTKPTVGNGFSQALHQNQQAPHQTTASFQKGTSGTTTKSRIITKKATPVPVKSLVGPNPMIQAAAVAAGARIVTPSTAASLLKAVQSKNAVHIRPGGGSLIKPTMPGSTKALPPNNLGTHPNVHYIRTGLASASQPPPTFSTVVPSIPQSGGSRQAQGNSVGPATGHLPSTVSASSSLPVALCTNTELKSNEAVITGRMCIPSMEEVAKPVEEMKVDGSTILSTEEIVKSVHSPADVVKCCGQNNQADVPNSDMVIEKEVAMENLRNSSQEMEVDEKEQIPVLSKPTEKENVDIGLCQDEDIIMQEASNPCCS